MSAGPSLGMESSVSKANVGKDVVVKGHLLSGEDLTIFGEVEGTIDIVEHRLTIAAEGSVRADVKAHDIDVRGYLEGKLEAVNKIYIRKGARLVGDLHSAGIVIEEGGYLRGNIELSTPPAHSHPATGDRSNFIHSRQISELEPLQQLSEAVLRS
jgi:cytoskeletal protein CcmA (bactofilin family)